MSSVLRVVPFAVTEEALKLLRSTHADFDSLPAAPRRGRLHTATGSGTVLGAYDFGQVRAQSEYLRLVSIVEAFVDTLSTSLFDIKTRGLATFVALLAEAADAQASDNWEERKAAFQRYHGVPLGSCAKYSDVNAAVLVRNAIAHGLGHLTRRQRNIKDRGKVVAVGVQLNDHQLRIDRTALQRCVTSCAMFIADVDTKTPR